MKCEACEHGDHENCGMQSWCECDDGRDGQPYMPSSPGRLDLTDDDWEWIAEDEEIME